MKTLKNKLYASAGIGIGVIGAMITKDATLLVVMSLFCIPMFFARRNWIY